MDLVKTILSFPQITVTGGQSNPELPGVKDAEESLPHWEATTTFIPYPWVKEVALQWGYLIL